MVVVGVTRSTPGTVPVKRGTAERGFRVTSEAGTAATAVVATSGVAMTSLLAMQEVESGVQRDREARRHGEAMLDELSELHRALLGADGPDLDRLSQLAERPIAAADPGLAGVLQAVRLRARIELARHLRDASM